MQVCYTAVISDIPILSFLRVDSFRVMFISMCLYIYFINNIYRHYYEFHNKSLLFWIFRVLVMWKVQECSSWYAFTKLFTVFFSDSLSLGSPRLLNIWATSSSSVCCSLKWKHKAEDSTSHHAQSKSTYLSSYSWLWFTCTNYLLGYIIGKRSAQSICKQIYICPLPLISHFMKAS